MNSRFFFPALPGQFPGGDGYLVDLSGCRDKDMDTAARSFEQDADAAGAGRGQE